MRLLTDNLSPAQRDQLEVFNYFDVVGGDTGTRYRIRFGNLMNVEQLDARGKRIRLLCFAPEGRLPVADTMLAQKIALELFETEAATLQMSGRSGPTFGSAHGVVSIHLGAPCRFNGN